MNWAPLLQTLAGVVIGGLLAFGSAHLLEQRRERTARGNQLRTAYSRWLALHEMSSLDLELLTDLTDELPYRDTPYLDLVASELAVARPNLRTLTELGHDILSLEKAVDLREVVAASIDSSAKTFALASRIVRAHQSNAHWQSRVSALERQLRELPADHPERPSITEGLARAKEVLVDRSSTVLADSRKGLKEIVELNARQVKLAQELVHQLAAHNRH